MLKMTLYTISLRFVIFFSHITSAYPGGRKEGRVGSAVGEGDEGGGGGASVAAAVAGVGCFEQQDANEKERRRCYAHKM
jgi:hypothetical protein